VTIYNAEIWKRLNGSNEEWVNQYFVQAANDILAMDIAGNVQFCEQSIHRTNVDFFQISVRQAGPGHLGIQQGTAVTGVNPIPEGGTRLPLWNVVMVSMSSGVDRNDRKFLRLPLYSSDLSGETLDADFRASVDTLYSANLLEVPGLVNTWGRAFTNVSCSPQVHDRDMSWNRRTRPGFKRGWVPV
jgi:hypothetical protein